MLGLIFALLASLTSEAFGAETHAFQHRDLTEVSGLAVSLQDPALLWALNDSGNAPALYRMDAQGRDLGRVDVPRSMNFDWEALASFDWKGQPALLIGDVGDNYAIRSAVSLYAVRDPGRSGALEFLWKLDFQYEDGPRDVEALAVDPTSGDILLISKRERPPALYRLAMPTTALTGEGRALRIGTLPHIPRPTKADRKRDPQGFIWMDMPSALDISRDGRRAVVVTLKDAYLYSRRGDEPWEKTFARKPRVITLPRFKQIEAGAFSADGRNLYIGSEKEAPNLARVPLPP